MRRLSGLSSAGILLSMDETDNTATRGHHGTERWRGLLACAGHLTTFNTLRLSDLTTSDRNLDLINPKSASSAAHFASRKARALPRVLHRSAGTAGERPRQRTLL